MGHYAQNTGVSTERSKAEIEATLRRYGAEKFMTGWEDGRAAVQFQFNKKMVRFILPLPPQSEFAQVEKWGKLRDARPDEAARNWEQACRQRWRALSLAIKAKLEAVSCGITSFEEEFLAHIIVPGEKGKTIGHIVLQKLENAYATHGPLALGWESK